MTARSAVLLLLAAGPCSSVAAQEGRDGCRVEASADIRQITHAVAACAQARQRLAQLFGDAAAEVWLEFVDEAREVSFLVRRDSVRAFVPRDAGPAGEYGTFAHWEATAPHEIAHALHDARTGLSHRYGTGNGDWFMEAVAMWAETGAERQHRLRLAEQKYRGSLSLADVLAMRHPSHPEQAVHPAAERFVTSVCRVPCPGRPDTLHIRHRTFFDGTQRIDTIPAGSPLLQEKQDIGAFYALSISVLQYVFEHGGAPAVRRIEQRLREGRGPDAVLDLPGLPPGFDAFSRGWSDWLKQAAQRDPP